MADEISVTTRLKVNNGSLQLTRENSDSVTQAAVGGSLIAQTIGTTYEAVSIGSDVGTAGYAYFRNLDGTNFVEIGLEVAAAFYPLAKLLPGESALLRLATSSLFAKADTAAVKLEVCVLTA